MPLLQGYEVLSRQTQVSLISPDWSLTCFSFLVSSPLQAWGCYSYVRRSSSGNKNSIKLMAFLGLGIHLLFRVKETHLHVFSKIMC